MSKKICILLLFAFFKGHLVIAQFSFDDISIVRLSQDDGLSQGSNYFRFEDSCGFMWITGNDAVNRYDGSKVKVYNLDQYFNDCPNLQQGYGFAEDYQTNIYIGSIRGLYCYNRIKDRFTLLKIYKDGPDNTVIPFAFRDGKVWCYNRNYQIATYEVKTGKVTMVVKFPYEPIASVHIYQLGSKIFYHRLPFLDNMGNVWIISNSDIQYYNVRSNKFQSPLKNKPRMLFYSCAYDAYKNKVLVGSDDGIYEIGLENFSNPYQLCKWDGISQKVNNIAVNKRFIAFGIENGAVGVKIKSDSNIKWIDDGHLKKYMRCNQFSFDKSDRLWVCDDGQGQIIFNFKPRTINRFVIENKNGGTLVKLGVSSFSELPDDKVVVQGSFVHDRKKNKLSVLSDRISLKVTRSYTDPYRKSIWALRDVDDEKDFCSKIFFLSSKKTWIEMFDLSKNPNCQRIQDLVPWSDGFLMASFSNGLYWLDPSTKSAIKIEGLPKSNPFKINEISKDRIVVSYLNSSAVLASVFPNKQVKVLQEIIPGVQSFYIQEDTVHDRYWVGTNQGIYLLDDEFKILKKFDANNGLAGTYIYGLLIDGAGNAWCSHQHGLSMIHSATFKIVNFDKSDGIQDWDYNNRAFFKSADGTLYFGGVNGFNFFKPPLHPQSVYKPHVYIDEILVNNKVWPKNGNPDFVKKMQLEYSENNIAIRGIVRDLENGGIRKLIYRIKKVNDKWDKWNYLTNNRLIIFNNLNPDDYVLQMGTFDKYQNKEVLQKTIFITIALPFYMELWFWVLVGFIIAALIFWVFYQNELAAQRNSFLQQLALEKQRNKITADLHDDIGATLSSLQINSVVASQLIGKDTAAAKVVLHKIESQSENLAERIGDIIWSMKPEKEAFLSLSSRIKNFANEILGSTEIHFEIQIDAAIDNSIHNFNIRKNILLITKEAINNVAKYSNASQLTIVIHLDQNIIKLEITDNGIGFATDEIRGNGISNMRNRTEELQGVFSIVSRKNLGTVILVKVFNVP